MNMTDKDIEKKINVFPTKDFFIKIIVKDIQLSDAILDLIDNSIDSYIENDLKEMKEIKIKFSENEFIIEDNCGGIKKEEIYEKVFRFGAQKESKKRTIGIFGIGMKRAIFKLGKNILLESDDGENFYSVRIDEKWLKDPNNWKLDFETVGKTKGKPLTRITITKLYPDISEEFKRTTFENELMERIKSSYCIFIEDKVKINVNNTFIEPYDFEFLYDKDKFLPFHKKYLINGIEVEIYAGYTPPEKKFHDVYGWYVFCNDRLIIQNDTTPNRTGWGGKKGKFYHYPEDKRFLGLVFFRSDDPMKLPWHTTKEDIQMDSKIYLWTQVEMRAITNILVNFIRRVNRIINPKTEEKIGKSIFKDVVTKRRKNIEDNLEGKVPLIEGKEIIETYIPQVSYIQYVVKTSLLNKIKQKLGRPYMSNKEAGEKTFKYFADMEEIKDE